MKKSELNAQDLSDWMHNHWYLYATQAISGEILRLWVSGQGRYRVIHGDETLYEGIQ